MSRLDEILDNFKEELSYEYEDDNRQRDSEDTAFKIAKDELVEWAIDTLKEVLGEPEYRETYDMALKSWTKEDYEAFIHNQFCQTILKDFTERIK